MPEQETLRKANKANREGKAPSTQAGEFVREEIHHIREGKHGARSAKQAIAIGLSKARRSGVALPPPKKGSVSRETAQAAQRDSKAGRRSSKKASASRSKASLNALSHRRPRPGLFLGKHEQRSGVAVSGKLGVEVDRRQATYQEEMCILAHRLR